MERISCCRFELRSLTRIWRDASAPGIPVSGHSRRRRMHDRLESKALLVRLRFNLDQGWKYSLKVDNALADRDFKDSTTVSSGS